MKIALNIRDMELLYIAGKTISSLFNYPLINTELPRKSSRNIYGVFFFISPDNSINFTSYSSAVGTPNLVLFISVSRSEIDEMYQVCCVEEYAVKGGRCVVVTTSRAALRAYIKKLKI